MKLFLLFLFAALTASAEIVGIGANSGIEGGKGIPDSPGGLQLQCEGRDIHYGNIWIEELYFGDKGTDF